MVPGAKQLRDWMDRRGFNQQETAEYLGFTEPYVSDLLTKGEGAGLRRALIMERRCGIPVEAWVTELDELAGVGPARAGKRKVGK